MTISKGAVPLILINENGKIWNVIFPKLMDGDLLFDPNDFGVKAFLKDNLNEGEADNGH